MYPARVTDSPWPRMPDFAPVRVTAESAIPLALDPDTARQWCRLDDFDQADILELNIRAAQAHLEGDGGITGIILTNQTWRQDFTGFSSQMWLAHWPILSITSVTYYDDETPPVQQTVATSGYVVREDVLGYYVAPAINVSWPSDLGTVERPVSITYVAGFGPTAASVPADLKQAIALMVSEAYENREQVKLDEAVRQLLWTRIRRNV